MTLKRNSLFVALVVVLGFAVQGTGQTKKIDTDQFTGTYNSWWMFGGGSVTLGSDRTFHNDFGSCTFSTQESGRFVYSDGVLRFTITKYTGKQNGYDKEVDLSEAKSRREFFQYPDDVKDEPPKTEFVLYPVKWGERTYLIYENDLANFTNAINLGLEPRESGPQSNYYGMFFLRKGDEEKPTNGKPSLPPKWQALLLSQPITATIVSVEAKEGAKEKVQIATIDKGSADGVKVGMKFIATVQDPAFWSDDGVVLSVEATSAKVQTYDRLVGEVLTTKYDRKDRGQ